MHTDTGTGPKGVLASAQRSSPHWAPGLEWRAAALAAVEAMVRRTLALARGRRRGGAPGPTELPLTGEQLGRVMQVG